MRFKILIVLSLLLVLLCVCSDMDKQEIDLAVLESLKQIAST